ncbi:MAG: hypothetical protein U9Q97_07175 [Acidobacteriota bacterium]|nr:hypothetical protein [Acidobacteriota bacterium]
MDIEHFSLEELMELHWKILKRIQKIRKMKLYDDLQKFDVGDKVSFKGKEEDTITGIVVRVNQKSLTIKTDQGTTWYVAPALVTKIQLLQQEYDANIYREAGIKWQKN